MATSLRQQVQTASGLMRMEPAVRENVHYTPVTSVQDGSLFSAMQGANLQEVMEHLLPVEEDKGKAEPAAGEAAASQQAKQDQANDAQPGPVAQQRDEGNKGAARSRQGDKRHQDRKPHDSSRPHQVQHPAFMQA